MPFSSEQTGWIRMVPRGVLGWVSGSSREERTSVCVCVCVCVRNCYRNAMFKCVCLGGGGGGWALRLYIKAPDERNQIKEQKTQLEKISH